MKVDGPVANCRYVQIRLQGILGIIYAIFCPNQYLLLYRKQIQKNVRCPEWEQRGTNDKREKTVDSAKLYVVVKKQNSRDKNRGEVKEVDEVLDDDLAEDIFKTKQTNRREK